ncbi:MAG: AraC family transcriptional regulator [Cyanobacteria bacterium P01_F01_bin.116]
MLSQPLVERPSDVLQSFLVHQESNAFNAVVSEWGQVRPCVVPEVTFHDHLIVLPIAGQLSTNFCPDGFTTQRHTCRAGNIAIYPAGTSTQCTIEPQADYRYNCLQLKTEALNGAISEIVDASQFELSPQFCIADSFIETIFRQFTQKMNAASSLDRLYVDSLSNTLFVYLLRHYAVHKKEIPHYNSGLSKYQLHRVLDYIESNLGQEIKLADIAELLGMSQYYFCRLFRQSMGVSPYKYVIQQRIGLAKSLLRQPQTLSIAAIALDCGFSNQSALSKHFRTLTGTTPKAYRQSLLSI